VSQLLQNLALATSGEGNFLLNIRPRPERDVDLEDESRLEAMGKWIRLYGESIYGSCRVEPLTIAPATGR
jgi:alpha-L-fucosidase